MLRMVVLLTRLVLRLETWSLMWTVKRFTGCFTLRWWNYCWRCKNQLMLQPQHYFHCLFFILCYSISVSDTYLLFCRAEVKLLYPLPLLKTLLSKLVQLEEIVTEAKWWEEPRNPRKRKHKKGKKTGISLFLSILGFTIVCLRNHINLDKLPTPQ